jgi:hypothetical protein
MKKTQILLCFFLTIPLLTFAEKWKQVEIKVTHENNGTQVYVEDYANKKLLVLDYKVLLKHIRELTCGSLYSGQQRDIVYLGYSDSCQENIKNQGSIYINLTDGNISKIFDNKATGITNYKERVTLLYDLEKRIFSLVPMFEDCKKPFTIQVNSNDDGPQINTVFLPNGNLFLEYAEPSGKFHTKTIPIDYKKLYADCRG